MHERIERVECFNLVLLESVVSARELLFEKRKATPKDYGRMRCFGEEKLSVQEPNCINIYFARFK